MGIDRFLPKEKEQWDSSFRYQGGVDKWGVEYAKLDALRCSSYNQALKDCKTALSKLKR